MTASPVSRQVTAEPVPQGQMRAVRLAAGATQGEVGAFFGLPQSTVSDWELGRQRPPEYVCARWRRACVKGPEMVAAERPAGVGRRGPRDDARPARLLADYDRLARERLPAWRRAQQLGYRNEWSMWAAIQRARRILCRQGEDPDE